MNAILRKIALANLVLSATETYKYEALGLIFGKESRRGIEIVNAIPYQTAKRKFNEVDDSRKTRMLKKLIENNNALIGDFHSHSDYKSGMHAKISRQDIRNMKRGMTSLIIGVEKIKRKNSVLKSEDEGKGISFAMNGYRYQIRCYRKTEEGQVQELRITTRSFKNPGLGL